MATLRLGFIEEDDYCGKLVARAEAHGFAGEGGAYFDKQELVDFAAQLGAFPMIGRPSVTGGFYEKSPQLEPDHFVIECYALDAKGHFGLRVRIAAEPYGGSRPGSQHAVTLEILTTYELLSQFSRALSALVRGVVKEAVLEGE